MVATGSAGAVAERPDPDREIVIRRTFEAPRELVWQVWTDAAHVGEWWGPDGFTTTTARMEVRPGGVWQHVMHGPDGTDYPNYIVYDEVVPYERLTWAHGTEAGEPPAFHALVTFEERDGRTEVTLRNTFPSAAARDHVVREYGAIEGGHQTLARFGERLERVAAGSR